MDVFKQFLDKNTAKPELKVAAGKDGGSSSQFLDKLNKMKFSREKLGIIAVLAVSSGVLFLVWHHPKLRYGRPAETARRCCKTRGSQTDSDELTCTTISVSGCPPPTICVSAPPTAGSTPCCAEKRGETATTAVDMEDSGETVVVHPSQKPRAILGSWSTRSRGPADVVSSSHDGGSGRRKRVSFSKNVVEPVGDNEAYRRNPRSARHGSTVRRLDNIKKNGDVSHKDAANRATYAGASRPPCHPDTIRNAMEQEPQPTAHENGMDVVKGCRHTRSVETAGQRFFSLKQQDRNKYDTNAQYWPSLPAGDNRTSNGHAIISKDSVCDQGQNCCKITGSLTCTSKPTQSDVCC